MGSVDWGVMIYAIPYMLKGALVTLEISSLSMLLGCLVGIVCGFLLLSEIAPLKGFMLRLIISIPVSGLVLTSSHIS